MDHNVNINSSSGTAGLRKLILKPLQGYGSLPLLPSFSSPTTLSQALCLSPLSGDGGTEAVSDKSTAPHSLRDMHTSEAAGVLPSCLGNPVHHTPVIVTLTLTESQCEGLAPFIADLSLQEDELPGQTAADAFLSSFFLVRIGHTREGDRGISEKVKGERVRLCRNGTVADDAPWPESRQTFTSETPSVGCNVTPHTLRARPAREA